MKRLSKRIISGVFALVTLFFACMPSAYALPSVEVNVDVVDLFQWIYGELDNTKNTIWANIWHLVDDDVCSSAPSVGGRHNFVEQRTQVDGKTGLYYVCEYCGKSAGEVAEEAYDEYVQELPATGYTSAGKLIYQFCVSDIVGSFQFVGRTFDSISAFPVTFNDGVVSFSCFNDSTLYMCYDNRSGSGSNWNTFSFSSNLCVPIEGSYVRISSPLIEYRYLLETGFVSGKRSYTASSKSPHYYFLEDTISFSFSESARFSSRYVELYAHLPVYEITLSNNTLFSSTYNINTRPTSITGGNYGIVGDDNQIITVTNNNKIVNETNNTYYNPATGQSSTITDWSYNYDGRIYNLTLDTGDKVQVEYGDQNITITENNVVEGDTIVNNYIIYYIVDGSGSDTPDPTPAPTVCAHNWQESSRTDPGCTSPGKVVYICSQCGQTKTETLKALGHDWQVERTVKTLYDEDGNVTQQGYTIYECTVCGEQYKDADSTGPPDGSVNDGGLIEWLNGLIKSLSDNLSGVVSLIQRFFSEIPKLFGGFLDFLSAMFPFLPEEIMLLFTFGMAAVVVIGVIKAIRR